MKIQKREAQAILQSLTAGVTPRIGLRHIVVGRLAEIEAMTQDFANIRAGGAAVRFIIGSFGSGKSFFLQLARTHAMEGKFVVANADLSPERRLHGSGDQAVALYRELMKNLSTQVRPDGNALPAIIEKWLSNVQAQVTTKQGIDSNSAEFNRAVQTEVMSTLSNMKELVHGFDFAQVINGYYRGYFSGNDALKSDALRWLRGEINTKTEAKKTLEVNSIIDDSNWYDYLKAFACFVNAVGYAGLLVNIDEAVNLFKISHSGSRNSNYEQLLKIFNDCMQGGAAYIGFIFAGTSDFIDDQRRGLFSYEALRTRLSSSRFEQNGLRDLTSPVLRLPPLTAEEVFVLLSKLRDLHRDHTPNSRPLDDQALQVFLEAELRRIGAAQFSTPRELIRNFLTLSNLLTQNRDKEWQEIIGELPPAISEPEPSFDDDVEMANHAEARFAPVSDPFDRFVDFKA